MVAQLCRLDRTAGDVGHHHGEPGASLLSAAVGAFSASGNAHAALTSKPNFVGKIVRDTRGILVSPA